MTLSSGDLAGTASNAAKPDLLVRCKIQRNGILHVDTARAEEGAETCLATSIFRAAQLLVQIITEGHREAHQTRKETKKAHCQ